MNAGAWRLCPPTPLPDICNLQLTFEEVVTFPRAALLAVFGMFLAACSPGGNAPTGTPQPDVRPSAESTTPTPRPSMPPIAAMQLFQ